MAAPSLACHMKQSRRSRISARINLQRGFTALGSQPPEPILIDYGTAIPGTPSTTKPAPRLHTSSVLVLKADRDLNDIKPYALGFFETVLTSKGHE